MHRFRPNVVVSGTQAFEEDDWDTFTVSSPSHAPCKFQSVMPCDRWQGGRKMTCPGRLFFGVLGDGHQLALRLYELHHANMVRTP